MDRKNEHVCKQIHIGNPAVSGARIFVVILLIMALLTPAAHASVYDQKEVRFNRIQNARDFGGYRTKNGTYVKKNVFIRSAELSYATSGDMIKLKKTFNLKRVYDFRHPKDYKYCPDRRIAGVTYVSLPIEHKAKRSTKNVKKRYRSLRKKGNGALRNDRIKSARRAGKTYARQIVMSSYSQRQYKKYFNFLLKNKNAGGVLIHCVHGKDRTGVAAFMTLVALGVPEKTAYRDYAMTNDWMKKYNRKYYRKYDIGVRTSELKYAVGKAKKKYGSMEKFLEKAYGLDKEDLKKLRDIYTTEKL